MIDYSTSRALRTDEFVDVCGASTRPNGGRSMIPNASRRCLANADLTVTAWEESGWRESRVPSPISAIAAISPILRSTPIFKRQGIGRELIRQTRALLGPKCKLILLAAPNASSYYPHIGLKNIPVLGCCRKIGVLKTGPDR